MAPLHSLLLSAALASGINAFTLYPSMNATAFAAALGVNGDCLAALNSTFNCDQDTFSMAGSVDSYQWEQDDLATLCTSDCSDAAKKWNDDVVSKCDAQQININGAMVPIDSVAGRYTEGLGIACLKSSNNSFCVLESQEWVGSDVIQPDCSNNSTTSSNATDSSCDPDSPENSRIANLYDDATLCSDCFVKMMHQRLSSPYLPDTDHSDYLVDQFDDIQDVCSTSMPALTTRALPTYTPVPTSSPTGSPSGNGTLANGTMANGTMTNGTVGNSSQPVCDGQMIDTNNSTVKRGLPRPYSYKRAALSLWSSNAASRLGARDAAENATQTNSTGACDALSLKYGVTTGDLQVATGTDDCSQACNTCMPARCDLAKVPSGASCDALTHLFSSATVNITTYQLLSWNPNIIGLCDKLQEGQYVCAGPPGGAYEPIDSPLGDKSAAENAANSGPGGPGDPGAAGPGSGSSAASNSTSPSNSTSSAAPSTPKVSGSASATPTSSSSSVSGAQTPSPTSGASSAPSPTQSGIAAGCKKFGQSKQGDNCVDFAKNNGITADKLYQLNPVLGDAKNNSCDKNFFSGYFYCVDA